MIIVYIIVYTMELPSKYTFLCEKLHCRLKQAAIDVSCEYGISCHLTFCRP